MANDILGRQTFGGKRRLKKGAKSKFFRNCDSVGGCSAGHRLGMDNREFSEYMSKLIDDTWRMVDEGTVDLDAVRIGFDEASGAAVWDYNLMIGVLMAAGHCYACAKNFVDSLALTESDDGTRENIMVVTKAEQAKELAAISRAAALGEC